MAMRIAKMKWIGLASAVFLGIAGAGIAVGIGQDKPPAKAEPPKAEAAIVELSKTAFPEIRPTDADRLPADRTAAGAGDSDMRRLQVARFRLALAEYEAGKKNSVPGPVSRDNWEAVRTLVSAAIDVFPSNEATKWLAWKVAVAKRIEASVVRLVDLESTQFTTRLRVEAEIELLKFKRDRAAVRDPKVVDLAKRQIQHLEQSLVLTVKLIEGGASDANAAASISALHRDLLHAAGIAFGESRESLEKFEAVEVQAKAVHAYLKKRFDAGTLRRQEVTVMEAHLLFLAGEIESLKSKLGPIK